MPAGTQPQINMTSHSVDISPAVLHHGTSSLDTASAASSIIDSNHHCSEPGHVIGFLHNFVMKEQLLDLQPPHVAAALDVVESFYIPGMKPSCRTLPLLTYIHIQ